MIAAWQSLHDAARELHMQTEALQGFVPWPDQLDFVAPEPRAIPAQKLVEDFALPGSNTTEPLIQAIRHAAPFASWKRTYTEEEVGADFRNRYGYFELIGPGGVFRSYELQAYVGYWGERLLYEWHHHEAEEQYFVLAGGATFLSEGEEDLSATAGMNRAHFANQNHAMRTDDQPILTYVIWRGKGVGEPPKMGRAA